MKTFLTIVVWLLFGLLSANYARYRGRDPYLWFFIGMFMGIFALLLLFLLPPVNEENEALENYDIEDMEKDPALSAPPPVIHEFQTKEWFYLNTQHQQQGPITFDRLRQLWIEGAILPTTLVWSEGMEEWKSIDDIPSLKEIL